MNETLRTKVTEDYVCPDHGHLGTGSTRCSCGRQGLRIGWCGRCGVPLGFESEDAQEPPRELVCQGCLCAFVGIDASKTVEWYCAEATPDDPDHPVQGVVEAPTPEDAAKAFTDGWDVHAGVVVAVRRLAATVRVRVVATTERSATREGTP